MSVATADDRPRYREAYPRLDVLKAGAAYRSGRDVCAFQDDRDRVLGVVRFTLVNLASAILTGVLGGRQLKLWKSPEHLDLLTSPNDVAGLRRAAKCPGCERRVQSLVYVDWWACAKCHRLLYRRQLVDRQTLDAEDFTAAERRLKELRPKWRHQRKFAERRAADEAIVERFKATLTDPWLRVASAAHQRRVEGVWMSLAELREDRGLSDYWTTFDEPRTVEDVGDS